MGRSVAKVRTRIWKEVSLFLIWPRELPAKVWFSCVWRFAFHRTEPTKVFRGDIWRETQDPTKNESRMSSWHTTRSDSIRFGRMGFDLFYIGGLGARGRGAELGTTRSQAQQKDTIRKTGRHGFPQKPETRETMQSQHSHTSPN